MELDLTGLSDEEVKAKYDSASAKAQELNSKETSSSAAELSAFVTELETTVAEAEAAKAELSARAEVKEKAEALKAKTAEFAAEKEAELSAAEEAKAQALEAEKAAIREEAKAEALAEIEAAKAEAEVEVKEEEVEAEAKISPKGAEVPEAQAPVAKAEEAEEEKVVALVASADIPGVASGTTLTGTSLGKAMFDRRQQIKGGGSDGEFVLVASATAEYDDDRTLTGDWESDQEKIKNVTGTDVIVASGGICSPTEAYYGLELLSGAARPVKDALPGFGATRGGLRFMAPPSIADLIGSARVTTEAEDTTGYGGSNGSLTDPKPSVAVTCGSITEVVVDAISSIITVGNLNARTYPELVEVWTKLAAAQHARVAETNLIDKIAAIATDVTDAKAYGATGSLLGTVSKAVAGFKSRHRITGGVNLRAAFPEWTKELLRTDIAREAPGDGLGRYTVTDADINSWFNVRGISPIFYVDTRTGAGMAYGAQTAGAVTDFPATIEWFLWVEGSFIFVDGGTLNLGLVRDSTLNSTNDYSVFVETFENLAFVGHEALQVTSTLQPDGSGPALQTIVTTQSNPTRQKRGRQPRGYLPFLCP